MIEYGDDRSTWPEDEWPSSPSESTEAWDALSYAPQESLPTTHYYAVIGTDSVRPVVWGVGTTEDDAQADAAEQEDRGDTALVRATAEAVESIRGGNVAVQIARPRAGRNWSADDASTANLLTIVDGALVLE